MSKSYYKAWRYPSMKKQKRMSARYSKKQRIGEFKTYVGSAKFTFDCEKVGTEFDAFYDSVIDLFEKYGMACGGFGMDMDEFAQKTKAPAGQTIQTEMTIDTYKHYSTPRWARKHAKKVGHEGVCPWQEIAAFFHILCKEPFVKEATLMIEDAYWGTWLFDDPEDLTEYSEVVPTGNKRFPTRPEFAYSYKRVENV